MLETVGLAGKGSVPLRTASVGGAARVDREGGAAAVPDPNAAAIAISAPGVVFSAWRITQLSLKAHSTIRVGAAVVVPVAARFTGDGASSPAALGIPIVWPFSPRFDYEGGATTVAHPNTAAIAISAPGVVLTARRAA